MTARLPPVVLPLPLGDVARVGAAIAAALRPGDVIGLYGDLGAGKTTLARSILAALGLKGEAPSPSFAIVQPYAPPEVTFPLLHVDLYRLGGPDEVVELGLDDVRSDHALLIEWPDRLGSRGWADMLELHLSGAGHGDLDVAPDARRLTAMVPQAWEGRWPFPT